MIYGLFSALSRVSDKDRVSTLQYHQYIFHVLKLIVFQIKLVNINASDVVDGKSAVVLGLIWTIILYFQVRILKIHFIF